MKGRHALKTAEIYVYSKNYFPVEHIFCELIVIIIYIFSTFKGTKHNIGKRHQFNCPEGDVGKVVSRLFQRRYNQI